MTLFQKINAPSQYACTSPDFWEVSKKKKEKKKKWFGLNPEVGHFFPK